VTYANKIQRFFQKFTMVSYYYQVNRGKMEGERREERAMKSNTFISCKKMQMTWKEVKRREEGCPWRDLSQATT
jgi:hypothetical protein